MRKPETKYEKAARAMLPAAQKFDEPYWWVNAAAYIERLVGEENAKLREAALVLAATGTMLLRTKAVLLPSESEKWEEACGKLNRALDPI